MCAPILSFYWEENSMEPTPLRGNPFLRAKILRFTVNFLRRQKGPIEDAAFFWPAAESLGRQPAIHLALASGPLECLSDLMQRQRIIGRVMPQNIFLERWNEPRTRRPFAKALLPILEENLADAERSIAATAADNIFYQRAHNMFRHLGLRKCEADLLFFAYVRHYAIWNWIDLNHVRDQGNRLYQYRVRLMCQATGLSLPVGRKLLRKSSRLLTSGCLDAELDFNPELESFLLDPTGEPLPPKNFARHPEPALPRAAHVRDNENNPPKVPD